MSLLEIRGSLLVSGLAGESFLNSASAASVRNARSVDIPSVRLENSKTQTVRPIGGCLNLKLLSFQFLFNEASVAGY